jgi:hypothetical protein
LGFPQNDNQKSKVKMTDKNVKIHPHPSPLPSREREDGLRNLIFLTVLLFSLPWREGVRGRGKCIDNAYLTSYN